MKRCYKARKFKDESWDIIVMANKFIEGYEADGFSVSVRQLFYKFVTQNLIPNTQNSYKRLASIINDARFAGYISWTAIEDRTRNIRSLAHWESPAEIVEAAVGQFRMDKWEGQRYRIEVYVEKDALIGVVERVCQELDVPCFSCRGYVSSSELWIASQRLIEWEVKGYETVILHLGDHDPSGIDMTRDIQDKFTIFNCNAYVQRIALTMDQIRHFNLPPNPAKLTDSRIKGYVGKHGLQSWELDALDPKFIENLIRGIVLKLRKEKAWKSMERKEKKARAQLKKVVKQLLKEFKS